MQLSQCFECIIVTQLNCETIISKQICIFNYFTSIMQCISETGLDFINQELKSNMQTLESFTVTPGTCFKKLYRIVFHSMLT